MLRGSRHSPAEAKAGEMMFTLGKVVGTLIGMGVRLVVGMNRALTKATARLEGTSVVREAENHVLKDELRRTIQELKSKEASEVE